MIAVAGNGHVYETFGITKRFRIKPLQFILNVLLLKLVLSAKCFIYGVVRWPIIRSKLLSIELAWNSMVKTSFSQSFLFLFLSCQRTTDGETLCRWSYKKVLRHLLCFLGHRALKNKPKNSLWLTLSDSLIIAILV